MQRDQIAEAARLAHLTLDPETDLTVEGADPVFETPFHLGEGAAVALGLVGQEADRLWRLRGGHRQSLNVDVRHAAASLVSYTYVDVPAADLPPRAAPPVTAIYPCRDGRWIHLHGSFTHAPGILAELGLGMDADAGAIRAATLKRAAFELEDALARQGLCVAVVRSAAEWSIHPQGALLATMPVVEVRKIGEAPPQPLPEALRPLSGVRVLDLTRVLAGPTCARTLAEHGADVLHIASPNLPTIERFEMDTGHGKRQAYLDLNEPAEAATLRELIATADIFSQGFQHGSLAKRGLGYEELAKLRPGLIYVSENCFGHEGPWARRPGWEQLAQTVTGIAQVQDPDHPRLSGAAMNDYTTGYFAALGAMQALVRRATEGGSWLVRVSLSQTSMWYYRLGQDADRDGGHGPGDVTPFIEEHETLWGRMRHLRPPLQMSETMPRWELPSAPLGSGTPTWNA